MGLSSFLAFVIVFLRCCLCLDRNTSIRCCLRYVDSRGSPKTLMLDSNLKEYKEGKYLLENGFSYPTKHLIWQTWKDLRFHYLLKRFEPNGYRSYRVVLDIVVEGVRSGPKNSTGEKSLLDICKLHVCGEFNSSCRSLGFIVTNCDEVVCWHNISFGLIWPSTEPDAAVQVLCSATSRFDPSKCDVRRCDKESGWSRVDLSRCTRGRVSRDVGNRKADEDELGLINERLVNWRAGGVREDELNPFVDRTVRFLTLYKFADWEKGEMLLSIINHLLSFTIKFPGAVGLYTIHPLITKIVAHIPLTDSGIYHFQSKFLSALIVGDSIYKRYKVLTFRKIELSDGKIGIYLVDNGSRNAAVNESFKHSKIILPIRELLSGQELLVSRLVVWAYRDGQIFNENIMSPKNIRQINSAVFSVLAPGLRKAQNLSGNLTFTLQHTDENSKFPYCMYLTNLGSGSRAAGEGYRWAYDDCSVVNPSSEGGNSTSTTCSCNRVLGSFALIMDLHHPVDKAAEHHHERLFLIAIIGCSVSSLALIITILTYSIFPILRQDIPSQILLNLCITLFLTNSILIVDIIIVSNSESRLMCGLIAVVLHYFLLSSLAWMAVDGFYMYLSLVKVFFDRSKHNICKLSLAAWGCPLVVVLVTVFVNFKGFYGSANKRVCFILRPALHVTFALPVGLTMLFNYTIFLLVLNQLSKLRDNSLIEPRRKIKMSGRIRRAIGLMVLLGLSWVFAILGINGAGNVVFSYLFAVCSSLQGFLIFIFYCLLKDNVRDQWHQKLCGQSSSDEDKQYNSKRSMTVSRSTGSTDGRNSRKNSLFGHPRTQHF